MKNLLRKKIRIPIDRQSGQVMLITVLMFLFISLSIVLGFGSAAVKNFKNTQDFIKSKQVYFTTESGIEDVVYRLLNGKPTTASMNLSLGGANTVTTVTDVGSEKEIISTGDLGGLQRKVKTHYSPESTGTSYSYGIQVGSEGFTLGNSGSGVVGNVYVNGDISGGSSFVTGTAIAVNKVPMDITQQNILPVSPPSTITFGSAAASQDFTQSFSPATTTAINDVAFYIKKTSTAPTGAVTVNIMNDNAGVPGSTVIATGTFDSAFTTSYVWKNVTLSTHPILTKDVTYWIVIDIAGSTYNASRYYTLGANTDGYTRGVGRRGKYGGSWLASAGTDSYFRTCMGGTGSTINSMVISGDAIAHTITNSTVTGTLYCHIGSGNNKGCTATSTDPELKGFSLTQAQIDMWKAAAEAGGLLAVGPGITYNSGTDTYNISSSKSVGPIKVDGNLTTSNNVEMTITGAIWITGNYTPGGGGDQAVILDSSYGDNSGMIIVDKKIDLSNGIAFSGASGHPKSFVLLLTESDCPTSGYCSGAPAITVGNNAGAVLLEAQNGTLHFNNNSGAKEATAKKIELANNATVTYELGVADTHFTTGPGGGGGISTWREIQ